MDGKLLLVTNVADLKPAEVVQRYKALADIESMRGQKELSVHRRQTRTPRASSAARSAWLFTSM